MTTPAPEPDLTEHQQAETIATYDSWAAGYAARNDTYTSGNLTRFIDAMPTGGLVVDAGCGTGRDAALLAAAGLRVLAVDASAGMLAHVTARQLPTVDPILGDLRNLPVADQVADGVWMAASLLHLPRTDAPAALSEAARIMRPGGRLHLTVKDGRGTLTDHVDNGPRHFTLFTADDVIHLCEHAGFTNVSVSHDDTDPRGIRWVVTSAHKAPATEARG